MTGKKPRLGCIAALCVFIVAVLGTGAIAADSNGGGGTSSAPAATPCTSKLTSDATQRLPFNTSALKCQLVWSEQDFNLMYGQDGPSTWSFVLSAPDSGGYIAAGFSPTGQMVGSSAVAGWVNVDGTGMTARQYFLAAENSADCKPDTGNLTLVKGRTTVLRSQSRLYLAFQLNAKVPPQNKLVYAVGPKGKIPGKDLLLAVHSAMLTGTVDFQATDGAAETAPNATATASNATGPCASKLTSDAATSMPFGTSSLKCLTAWSSQDFTLLYAQDNPNTWSFVLSAPDSGGYVAVGFSPSGRMVGSSAVAGWMTAAGKGMARQYYLASERSRDCRPDTGSLPLVEGKTVVVRSGSRLYLAFQLNATAPPQNRLIYAVGPQGSIPGTDLLLTEHRDMVASVVDFQSGATSQDGGGSDSLQTTHGLLALLGWGVVVPVGILVARYAKRWDPQWFYGHMFLQFLGFGAGIAAVVTGFKLEDKTGNDVDTHKAIGVVILVLGTLQVLAFLARPDKTSKVRRYWNWYHHYVGRAAAALAVGNIFYGLSLADEDTSWSVGYGVFLGVWVLLAFSFELCRCCARRK